MSRDVAVKILREELTDDDEARFERECRTLGSLSHHPNIVTVYGSGVTDEGRGYLVLEYCPGSVQDRIQADGPMPWRDAASVLAAVSDAVGFAHDQGVLHRDIKPHNILYSSFDTPQLADFGIARMDDEFQTGSGAFTGSLAFMAPEIFAGQPASAGGDVWSLAATGYSLVTGNPPFSRPDDEIVTAVIMRAQTDDPPPLASLGVPPAMEELLVSALARDPSQRISSAAELAAGFRALIGARAATDSGSQATAFGALPVPLMPLPGKPESGPVAAYAHTVAEYREPTDEFALPPPPPPPPPPPAQGGPATSGLAPTATPPAPPSGARGRAWVAAVVGVVVVAAVVVGAFAYFGSGSDEATTTTTAPDPDETTTPVSSSTTSSTSTSTIPPTRRVTLTGPVASSTAPSGIDSDGQPVTYDAANLVDGRSDTAWRTAGDGIDETLTVTAPGQRITRIGMIPGYDKVDPRDGSDRFVENRRVSMVRWTFADGTTVEQTFIDSPDLQLIDVDAKSGPVTAQILITTDAGGRDFVAVSEIVAEGY